MNEKQLSIGQVEKIMGWSYPTALKFAGRYGEMVNGKWYVPSGKVWTEVLVLGDKANATKDRFLQIGMVPEPAT